MTDNIVKAKPIEIIDRYGKPIVVWQQRLYLEYVKADRVGNQDKDGIVVLVDHVGTRRLHPSGVGIPPSVVSDKYAIEGWELRGAGIFTSDISTLTTGKVYFAKPGREWGFE